MSNQDATTEHREDRSMTFYAKRAGKFALTALMLSGCIIIKVPPPARNDPFQAPNATPITIQKGSVHKFRFDCGAQATFRSAMAPIDNLVIAYNGQNLSPVDQKPSTPLRLTWKGPGASMDVPFNVGSQNTRKAMGNITMNATAGAHEFAVAMPTGPDCGPTKVTIAFR
jgi:hypothetical protein